MDANRIIAMLLAMAALPACSPAQMTGGTIRHHIEEMKEPGVAPLVTEAEAAIERKDYAAAEQKLSARLTSARDDYQAWYDLGYVFNATGRQAQAIDAYRRSVAIKPDVFESNFNLGRLLASTGSPDAAKYLRAATQLKPTAKPQEGLERAWLTLGRVLAKTQPDEALAAFRKAAELQPGNAEPYLSAGGTLELQGRLDEAAQEYEVAARLEPKSSEPLAALVNLYTRTKRLPDAEAALQKYLSLEPANAIAHVQLGRVLMAEGRFSQAVTEYETALKIDPNDPGANQEMASALIEAGQYDKAVARYQMLVARAPQDAELRYALGSALLKAKKFPEAEEQLLTAVKLKPAFGEAYGDLALAASENKNYTLVIQALDARARYLPESPGTYFLRATAYDNLKAYKQAADSYRQFLLASAGKFPEQEWQARHRLLAIDPKHK
jgi:tetratricopeptide (TPR) repeat protein